jgi:hypothetical protein
MDELNKFSDNQNIYGVFYKKGNMHDGFLRAFETENEAINYIREKSTGNRIMFYREMKIEDIHYWVNIYDKK